MHFQRTLRRESGCVGIGLHSGRKVRLTLKPAPADTGIVFERLDRNHFEIPATSEHLARLSYATCLSKGEVRIETVEHLLAALATLGIDNAIVELDAPEVPIMDGSAAPFIYLIHEAGLRSLAKERSYLKLTRPIAVESEGRQVAAYPADSLRVSYTINFDHPLLKHQTALARDRRELVRRGARAGSHLWVSQRRGTAPAGGVGAWWILG